MRILKAHRTVVIAMAFAMFAGFSEHSHSQCDAWHPFSSGGQIGVDGWVEALTVWNGDLVVGGAFAMAGGQLVYGIARWDGSAWHPFTSGGQIGVGPNFAIVQALTVWNGNLVASGSFTTAGGEVVNGIARWDGSEWHPFTSGGQVGVSGGVASLTVWNGDLIAGGFFNTAGGQTVNNIARWNGSAWQPFTSGEYIGVDGGFENVLALTVWNGDLITGGSFTAAGGQTVNRIARWNGLGWHPFTSGGQIGVDHWVESLAVWNGDLIAGGQFTTAGGQAVNHIARWGGSDWHTFTAAGEIGVNSETVPPNPVVLALEVWNGDLVAGGGFVTAGGQTVNKIARWDGAAWHPFNSGIGADGLGVGALKTWNGDLICGGIFTTVGGQTANGLARWDGCLEPSVPGDITGDGAVNVNDLLAVINAWGPCPAPPAACDADIAPAPDGDGHVNVSDLLMVINNWG